jgi:uncharacterized protein
LISKVLITEEAIHILEKLKDSYGSLLFHISGGCCDGTVPVCLPVTEFIIDGSDILVGEVIGVKVYTSKDHIPIFEDTELIIGVSKGMGSSFSLEIPLGYRFKLITSVCKHKGSP